MILASDLGEGHGHGHGKMGYILAGNLGTATPGVHFDAGPDAPFDAGGSYFYDASRYDVNQLLNSILDMAGVVDAEGMPITMGLGIPRRIDPLFG